LFAAADLVWPPISGGRVRALSQLRALASLPEVDRVVLFSLSEEPLRAEHRDELTRELPKVDVLEPVFHPVHLFRRPGYLPRVVWLRGVRGVPYLAAKWDSPRVRAALERALGARCYDVVWLGALGVANYLPVARRLRPGARIVLDGHNVESEIWGQFARRQRGIARLIADAEWRAALRFERDTLRGVDAVAAISTDDARAYRDLAGVDARFVPQVVPFVRRRPPAVAAPRLCYVGTLSWRPNMRGLDWFFREVWPHVRARVPEATLDLVGSGLEAGEGGAPSVPPGWQAPGVTTVGFMADLAPVYERSAALVAPILDGGGVRLKLLEGFRHGVPVVTTPQGAAGLPIHAGHEALVENDPRAFAACVARVATSGTLQARLRDAAYAFLERHHTIEAAQQAMRAVIGLDTGDARAGGRASRQQASGATMLAPRPGTELVPVRARG